MRYTNTALSGKIDYDGEVLPPDHYPDRGEHFYAIITVHRISPLARLFSDAQN
jgi:hypothetical protein